MWKAGVEGAIVRMVKGEVVSLRLGLEGRVIFGLVFGWSDNLGERGLTWSIKGWL